ncbi:SAM-dependent methyltransferase [Shimia abyssi]|uniref:Methyltransferase family protein n=1 Tax=Shimia abyssi TaxID=1662395 RepID=A0A2P8FIU1_9RHOB|nr:SAM-dependent methyltransferase [Shimia abyssi]PSL21644.1 hypothetical protein CLV88_10167 [Shimia abyssi]
MQNTSHAVMAQRTEARDSLDNFPTPPWATRALLEHIIEQGGHTDHLTCLEPACGAGHMAKALGEYFGNVAASDVYDYGYGEVSDFLSSDVAPGTYDWVITNPPFRLAEEFILHGLSVARRGVAVLVRTVFLESVGRYDRIFSTTPPSTVAQFVERVPMVKGRLDKKASTATGYAWVVWEKGCNRGTQLLWVPPCRKALERATDYDEKISSDVQTKFEVVRENQSELLI